MWYFVNKGTSSNNHDDDEEDFNCGVRRGGNKGGRGCKSGEEDAAIDVLNELEHPCAWVRDPCLDCPLGVKRQYPKRHAISCSSIVDSVRMGWSYVIIFMVGGVDWGLFLVVYYFYGGGCWLGIVFG